MSDDKFLLSHRFSVEVSVGPASMLGTMVPGLVSLTGLPTGLDIHGYFTEVSGLEASVEVIEYKTTTLFGERLTQKIPGPPTWGQVTLKKGVSSDMGFWLWHELVQKGFIAVARASVTITMYDLQGSPQAQWDLDKAWPSKISGPALNAASNDAAIEEIVLEHEGLRRVSTNAFGAAASMLTDIL